MFGTKARKNINISGNSSDLYENENILKSIKQVKIASLLNIVPETLSRNLAKMRRENIIDKEKGYIRITDRKKLKERMVQQ